MLNSLNKAVTVSFLFVLIASISVQSSNASSNQTQPENTTDATLFTSGNQTLPIHGNETIQSTLSELIPKSANKTNQSAASEQLQNIIQTNQTMSANLTNASLIPTIQKLRAELAKLPGNASKSEIQAAQEKFLASSPFGPAILDQTYRVTVTFDSISVHADHDYRNPIFDWIGTNCCSGEWFMAAFVQGKGVTLFRGSNDDFKGIVDGGDLINFVGKSITVDIPKGKPLSIMTVGYEDDTGFWDSCPIIPPGGCGFYVPWWADDLSPLVMEILEGPVSTWSDALHQFQVEHANQDVPGSWSCDWCEVDRLGYINKLYYPPEYGQGAHVGVISDIGDFTLRFTITVDPPSEVPEVEPGLDCNNELGVNRASASSTQNPQFGPEKTIDNNPSTYWMSTSSLNPSITLDMGAQRIVCMIKISWQDGNTHPYRFNVAVSKDGTAYTNVFSGMSSGTTITPELYGIGENDARYVKVTVTQSTQGIPSSVAKISEIDILGFFTGNEPGGPGEGPIER